MVSYRAEVSNECASSDSQTKFISLPKLSPVSAPSPNFLSTQASSRCLLLLLLFLLLCALLTSTMTGVLIGKRFRTRRHSHSPLARSLQRNSARPTSFLLRSRAIPTRFFSSSRWPMITSPSPRSPHPLKPSSDRTIGYSRRDVRRPQRRTKRSGNPSRSTQLHHATFLVLLAKTRINQRQICLKFSDEQQSSLSQRKTERKERILRSFVRARVYSTFTRNSKTRVSEEGL